MGGLFFSPVRAPALLHLPVTYRRGIHSPRLAVKKKKGRKEYATLYDGDSF